MAIFNFRLPDNEALAFDAWAAPRGGRSAALRALIRSATPTSPSSTPGVSDRLRPVRVMIRLSVNDGAGLAEAAASLGLTPSAWAAALVRRRLVGRPTWSRPAELTLIAVQGELRRIGVNVNQIARALNTAILEGRVLDLELDHLESLRLETRGHLSDLRDAMRVGADYWLVDL